MSRPIKTTPSCLYGNLCVEICVQPTCRKPGFICSSGSQKKSCCGLFHQHCQKMKWSQFQGIICQNPNTKLPQLFGFQELMENFFSTLINKITIEHQNFKKWLTLYGYSSETMNYINLINEEKFNSISGSFSHLVISELFMNEEKQLDINLNTDECIKLQKLLQTQLQNIKDLYSNESLKQKMDKMASISTVHSVPQIIIIDSKIERARQEFSFFKNLFPKQNIKGLNLVYRASQNKFSTQEFHRICDQIPNTLTIIETEYGTIIGGYTPLPWNTSKKHWAADKSGQSFMYSLDLREKFTLNLTQFAIACNPEKGPIFGCCDICVVDKANIEKCNSQFPISYNNHKYMRGPETCIAFTGNAKGRFNTREWEVYQVSFHSQ